MKKIKIAFVVLLMCLSAVAFCEEETAKEPEVFNNAVGFTFTTPSSLGYDYDDILIYGLQYQHWFDKVGVEVTGSMFYDENYVYSSTYDSTAQEWIPTYGSKLDWKVLAEAQFVLCTFDVTNLSIIKNDSVFRLYFWVNGGVGGRDLSPTQKNLAYLYAGTGIGMEAVFWKHISIPLELGYSGQFLNNGGFDLCGSTGVRFRF